MPASGSLKSVVADHEKLKTAWKKKDLAATGKLLSGLKPKLLEIQFLPTQELDGLKQVGFYTRFGSSEREF